MEQGVTISDILSALRRRLALMIFIAIAGTSLAITVALYLPPKYSATSKILVESQSIPLDMARTTVMSDPLERLRLIEQRLMARESLLELADRLNLYPENSTASQSAKVEAIREATQIDEIPVDERRRSPGVSAFTITYESKDAATAARVANEFVSMVIEQNLRTRASNASETLDFFKTEVDRLLNELLTTETRITEFKNKYSDALPDSLDFRRTELAGLRDRMYELEQREVELHERRRELVQAMDEGRDIALPGRELSPEEVDLQSLRRQLVQQRGIYAETHPEIRQLVAKIRALERSIVPGVGDASGDAESAQAALDESAGSHTLRQIELIENQLALIAEQRASITDRKAALEGSIAQTPKVEMALNALNRRYANLQTQYQSTVAKQAEAATGEKLEVNRKSERFEVLEQAQIPEKPISPNRKLIAAGGGAASAGLALGLVILLELINTRVRTSADLLRHLELRPVATVPMIRNRVDKRWRTGSMVVRILIWVLGVPAALYLVDRYVWPLSILLKQMMDSTGLTGLTRLFGVDLG